MQTSNSHSKPWTPINALREPYNDATNYRGRASKEFFRSLFLKTDELERCLSPNVYFLMGEKGAGKTAYAVYLENNETNNHRCKLTTMTETQYKRFIELKKQKKLTYSDYANIWRSMLLFLCGRMVVEKSKNILHSLTGKFSKVESEIAKWSKNAMNPEVESAFEAINSYSAQAKVSAGEFGEFSGEKQLRNAEQRSVLKHHLLETENSLKEAISSLSLSTSHVLFIDGVDYRPESVGYNEYIECIKGLGEAVWQLNTEFFNTIRDSAGRIKIVLLVRPDVFHSLNLYNSNSRLQDNCVFLNWTTTDREHKSSMLYEVSGKYFSSQQKFSVSPQEAWEHYYPVPNDPSGVFRRLLKQSFQKPRDILTFIKITQKKLQRDNDGTKHQYPSNISTDPSVSREYSDYLLGEVRNYAAFYMTQEDFTKYLKLFQYLHGRSKFSMSEFSKAFASFRAWADGERFQSTSYLRDPDSLLQLFYDVNVIGYSETIADNQEQFYHWSYRERSVNNIAPQVKTSGSLMLNPGIAKALDVGKVMVDQEGGGPRARQFHDAHRANRPKRRKNRNSGQGRQAANLTK